MLSNYTPKDQPLHGGKVGTHRGHYPNHKRAEDTIVELMPIWSQRVEIKLNFYLEVDLHTYQTKSNLCVRDIVGHHL